MSFKYINPGYAEFLDVAGGTTIADTVRSRTGVMFYQPTEKKGLVLAETPTELYGKFDVYISKDRNDFSIKVAMLETNGYALDGMGLPREIMSCTLCDIMAAVLPAVKMLTYLGLRY